MPGSMLDRFVGKFSETRKINSRITIIRKINAVIPPGKLVAILGTSGSGNNIIFIVSKQCHFYFLLYN